MDARWRINWFSGLNYKINEWSVIMSQQVIDQARVLSETIAECEELRILREAEVKLANDPIAQQLVGEYQSKQAKLAEAKEQGREVSPEEQADFDNVEKQLENNTTISTYLEAQGKFADLMDSVNYLIMKGINGQGDSCDSEGCSTCCGCD